MKNSLFNSVVLITGGTGTFGSAFLDKCLTEGAKEIRIFSRDEKKQYDMSQRYRDHGNVKFFLGDIRDKHSLDVAMHGADYVFHAAAMKQVPSCELFPMEAVKTNIIGSENVLVSAIQKHVRKVVCLSTDKAVYPTSAMGMTKSYMEKIAFQKAEQQKGTEICITRFGNLVASRGSAVPLFIEQVQNGLPVTITDPNMTRFMMTVGEAIELVCIAFSFGKNGELLAKKSKACTTGDLANAVCKYLKLNDDYPRSIIGIRPGEKMHESLLTEAEAENTVETGDYYIVSNRRDSVGLRDKKYRSDEADRMSEDDVLALIHSIFEKEQG